MTTVREMTSNGAAPQQIARLAGTSAGHITQATRLLRDAPDLAGQVEQGQIGLTTAYRALCERRFHHLPTNATAAVPQTKRAPGPQPAPEQVPPALAGPRAPQPPMRSPPNGNATVPSPAVTYRRTGCHA
jgi:hypothetical protein